MVDGVPLESAEDIKNAMFKLTNAVEKLGGDFAAWEKVAFTSGGPPDFITIREGLRALHYTVTMTLHDVSAWCATNTPQFAPVETPPFVELWVREGARTRPLLMPAGQTVSATYNGVEIRVREHR